MRRTTILIFFFLTLLPHSYGQSNEFKDYMNEFIQEYEKLNLPYFNIDYKANLQQMQPLDSVLNQEKVFLKLAGISRGIDRYKLSKQDRISYELMRYEINLNVERIYLEKRWWAELPDSIPSNGVFDLAIGKDWYRYLLHHWVDRAVEPEQLFEFGKSEVERVTTEINALKIKSGLSNSEFEKHINDESFFYNSAAEVHAAFEAKKVKMTKTLEPFFPFLDKVPDHTIKQFKESTKIQTPAFY